MNGYEGKLKLSLKMRESLEIYQKEIICQKLKI
jgi:hypothetical protein